MSAVSSSKTSSEDPSNAELTLLQSLAQRIHAFEKRQLTKAAIAQARACILDAIGVTLAGYPEACTQILLKTPGVATAPGPPSMRTILTPISITFPSPITARFWTRPPPM